MHQEQLMNVRVHDKDEDYTPVKVNANVLVINLSCADP